MDMQEQLNAEELAELQKYIGPSPVPDEKFTAHKFLHEVSISEDTTKTGFLSDIELGVPKNPLRTFKRISLICDDIMDNPYLKKHFLNEGEILTSSSLSKEAKLLELAVVQRRELADVTKRKQKPKGFFKKREEEE